MGKGEGRIGEEQSARSEMKKIASALMVFVALLFTISGTAGAQATARPLPSRISDSTFWRMVTDISEPGGYFRLTDNFTSNEMEIGELSSMLRSSGINGGVYIGVGPEQNLSYIAAIRPKMAFVVDIRRQAVVQHLMFKAMFELAKDRAAFLTLLFARPRPEGIDSSTSIQKIWELYKAQPPDTALARSIVSQIERKLTKEHGFALTVDETTQLKSVIEAFQYFGPNITTQSGSGGGRGGGFGGGRSFADMTGFSLDASGQPQSFLSTEDNFRYVKSIEDRNLLVPVSGDFGGPKAIRAIGAWLKTQDATVSAFYVSNVEQYLFQDGKSQAFYENAGTLPVDATSVFIRPYSMRRFGRGGGFNNDPNNPVRSLCPIQEFLKAAAAGRVMSNDQALACAP
jgi:hypothetical protein